MFNMIKNYVKLIGRIGYKVADIDGIKNVYQQTVNISKMLAKDRDGQFALRAGAIERLEDLYNNAPNVTGRLNFINSMRRTGLRDSDIDKAYSVEKAAAQVSFFCATLFVSAAVADFTLRPSGLLIPTDIGCLSAALMLSCYWFRASLYAYQYRTYNQCTVKQWITSETQWWAEAFKAKEPVVKLNVVLSPRLVTYKTNDLVMA